MFPQLGPICMMYWLFIYLQFLNHQRQNESGMAYFLVARRKEQRLVFFYKNVNQTDCIQIAAFWLTMTVEQATRTNHRFEFAHIA